MPPIDRDVARQAAHWLMLSHGGQMTTSQRQDCRRWRAANPEHERAWQRATQVQSQLGLLPRDMAMGTLNRERRLAIKHLLLLAIALPSGYAAQQLIGRQQWLADARTAVGERRDLRLADGTQLFLNSDSAVDIQYSADQRLIHLRRGEILVDSGSDPGQPRHRPLRVQTEQGLMQALGTRFSVRRLDEQAVTRLSVFEGAVRIHAGDAAGATLAAGQQASFSSHSVGAVQPADEFASSWTRGQLVADGLPLADFLDELGRYRPGWLRCDPAVADLRIGGTFQLANTDAILAALPHTLPVRVEQRTRYWVVVSAR